MHLLIPFAACSADACQQALQTLPLPNLAALLQRLSPTQLDAGDDFALSLPHERALARALGLPADNGLIPWAARDVLKNGGQPGTAAWAFITPCHWRLATDHFLMDDPDLLQIEEQESKELMGAMAGFFVEDGITLHYASPTCWRAEGEVFRGLPSASLDRVRGRSLDIWMPEGEQARLAAQAALELKNHEFNAQGVEMNQRYVSSAVVPDATGDEEVWKRDPELYLQATTRPGAKTKPARTPPTSMWRRSVNTVRRKTPK